MLKIDFYESGQGETIAITFPNGGLGIVDAHPSTGSRAPIEEIIKGKYIHFVCLTHPHADHALDLAKVLKSKNRISEFWHTISDIRLLANSKLSLKSYPARHQSLIKEIRSELAEKILDVLVAAIERHKKDPSFFKNISNETVSTKIDDVEIYCLNPSREDINKYLRSTQNKIEGAAYEKTDENKTSVVLALKYGKSVVLLSADALIGNWRNIIKLYGALKFPKAGLMKIPHHGSLNAFSRRKNHNYLRLCSKDPKAYSILFAGSVKHPHKEVHDTLKDKTNLLCLNNGLKIKSRGNPLGIDMIGAYSAEDSYVCNPVLSFNIETDGTISCLEGQQCDLCTNNKS